MIYLRALIFYLGMTLATVLVVALAPPFLLLPFKYLFGFMSLWAKFVLWWLKVIFHLTYRVEGRENIPAGPAIIMAKHQSAWETIALQAIFPPQTWVLKRSLLWIPFFGWGLAMLKSIGIDRKAGRKALQQLIDGGKKRLAEGIWLVIFPEGTRIAPGEHGTYHIGGAMLAQHSGYPVVPVAHNAGEYWPKNSLLKRPGVITVVVGPRIETEGRKAGAINGEVEEWIESTMNRITGN